MFTNDDKLCVVVMCGEMAGWREWLQEEQGGHGRMSRRKQTKPLRRDEDEEEAAGTGKLHSQNLISEKILEQM